MSKKITVIALGLLFSMAVMGQSRHEVSIYGAGGMSTMWYDMNEGKMAKDFEAMLGGTFGFGYNFFFSNHFGIGSGVELANYNSKAKFDNYAYSYNGVTGQLSDYSERQHSLFVNVPLMFQYQTGGKHRFFAAAGAKLGIPVLNEYHTTGAGASFTTAAGVLQGKRVEKDIDYKLTGMASAELGVKWRLSDLLSLYTGVYCDYGFTDIGDKQTKDFVVLNGDNFTTNGVMNSRYATNKEIADEIHPLSAGVKVRLAFRLGRNLEKKQEEVVEVVILPSVIPPPAPAVVEEKRPEPPQPTDAQKRAYADAKQALGTPVNGYKIGVYELTNAQKSELDKKADILKKYPGLTINCIGNTCDIAGEAINEKLGMQRAEAAKDYLVSKGISENRITIDSRGKDNPIVENSSEANRKINRRVEFKLTGENPQDVFNY